MRVKCVVSYDGSRFHGFQVQDKERTVQGEIQKALKKINEEEVIIHASGRTDARYMQSIKFFILIQKKTYHHNNGKEQLITLCQMIYIY